VTDSPDHLDHQADRAADRAADGADPNSVSGSRADTSTQPRPKTYGRVAARGMIWMAAVGMLSKCVGFVSNLILGWLLTEHDFGLFGLAVSLSAFAMVLSDGGTARIIRHPDDYRRLGRAVARLSLIFNMAAATVLMIAAFPLGAAYDEPILPWMIIVVALALPIGNRPLVLRAALGAHLRFREISQVTATCTIVRGVSMIGFALSGLGPLSFVIPMVVVNAVQWVLLSRLVREPIPGDPLNRNTFAEIFGSTRWIIVGMLAAAIINSGAPFAIRLFQDTGVVGLFFFGFAVAVVPSVLFAGGLRSVIMPSMARLRDEPPRQAAALVNAVGTLALVGAPVAFGSALIAAPMTRFLWQGRWDAAIPVIVILGLPLAFRLSGPIGGSLLEARGEWRLRAVMLWIDAILTLVAAGLGAWLGSVTWISICIAIERVVMGVLHCSVAGGRVSLPAWRLLAVLVPPHLVAAAAAAATIVIARHFALGWHDLAQAIFIGAVYAAIAGTLFIAFFHRRLRVAFELVLGRRGRKSQTDTAEVLTERSTPGDA